MILNVSFLSFKNYTFIFSLPRCLNPVLSICAILTLEKEPFINTLDDKSQIKKV